MNKSLSGFILYRNSGGKLSKEELIEKNLNRVIRNEHLLSRYTWRTDHYGSISAGTKELKIKLDKGLYN